MHPKFLVCRDGSIVEAPQEIWISPFGSATKSSNLSIQLSLFYLLTSAAVPC